MTYPTYDKYKESGVPWLGQVPEGWDVSKISYEYDVQLGKMLQPEPKSEDDELLPYLRAANLAWAGVNLSHVKEMWISPAERSKYALKRKDVLLSEGGDVGRASYWDSDQVIYIQNAINRLRPFNEEFSHSKYAYYWFSFLKENGLIDIVCNSSTIAHYTAEKVKATKIIAPPLSEQKAIAAFLDKKTAEIDALIAKKEELLKLLAEQRTALITHAVTKGLNPSAPMKDSGIDWLGHIPAHWEVKRLRFAITTNLQKSKITAAPETLVSFVPMDAVGEYGGLRLETEKPIDEVGDGYTYFAENDVVVAKITPCFENGKGAFAKGLKNGIAFGTTELHVLRASSQIVPEYLFLLTTTYPFRKIGESEMYGAGGQKRVPERFIKDLMVGLPTLEEQQKILDYVDGKLKHMDAVVDKTQQAIDRLKEYRTALITNAVTGKIDVRGYQSKNKEKAA